MHNSLDSTAPMRSLKIPRPSTKWYEIHRLSAYQMLTGCEIYSCCLGALQLAKESFDSLPEGAHK